MDYLDRVPDFSDSEHVIRIMLHESNEFNLYRLIVATNERTYSIDIDRRSNINKFLENIEQLTDEIKSFR